MSKNLATALTTLEKLTPEELAEVRDRTEFLMSRSSAKTLSSYEHLVWDTLLNAYEHIEQTAPISLSAEVFIYGAGARVTPYGVTKYRRVIRSMEQVLLHATRKSKLEAANRKLHRNLWLIGWIAVLARQNLLGRGNSVATILDVALLPSNISDALNRSYPGYEQAGMLHFAVMMP